MHKNNYGVLKVSDEDKKLTWKSYHEKLLNPAFAWDRNSLTQEEIVSRVSCLIDKVREAISKKNGNAIGPSGVVSKMVKTAGKIRIDMITDLVDQIIVEFIPTERELL